MNVKEEIEQFAKDEDKPILLKLFSKYHLKSQWGFVAKCTFQKYGEAYYECNRIWSPTEEGLAIYKHLEGLDAAADQQPKAMIKVGKFYLSEHRNGEIWLEHESGEGMNVSADQLLNLIDEYWVANF